jgi:Mycothiol maleylpyruvate isomerase N-terminal domain
MTVFDDLAAEQERLEGILSGLEETQWTSPSGAAGCTVADVVLHMAQSEESVVTTVSGGEGEAHLRGEYKCGPADRHPPNRNAEHFRHRTDIPGMTSARLDVRRADVAG